MVKTKIKHIDSLCPKCNSNNIAIWSGLVSGIIATRNYFIRCDDCGYEIGGYRTKFVVKMIWDMKRIKNVKARLSK